MEAISTGPPAVSITNVLTRQEIDTYMDSVTRVIISVSPERAAQIYCELNNREGPPELKDIYPYSLPAEKRDLELEYVFWSLFGNIVERLIPEYLIKREHYKKIAAQGHKFKLWGDLTVYTKIRKDNANTTI